MKELLEYLAQKLVSKPKEVRVTENTEADGTIRLTLSTAPEDMGMIIGKGGKTIVAIRSLIKTAAVKSGKKVLLELEESSSE